MVLGQQEVTVGGPGSIGRRGVLAVTGAGAEGELAGCGHRVAVVAELQGTEQRVLRRLCRGRGVGDGRLPAAGA